MGDALRGLRIAWAEESNFRFHTASAVLALAASWLFSITPLQWVAVALAIGAVFTAELLNTALEELCDKFQPEHDPRIGKIKDLAAAAVLAASCGALAVGCIIFIPRILALI